MFTVYVYVLSGESICSFFLSSFLSFCIACCPHCLFFFSRFQIGRCLPNNTFPLCVSAPISRCHCPRKACGLFRHLRFELQTSNHSIHGLFFFPKTVHNWVTLHEGDMTNKYLHIQPLSRPCIFSQPDSTRKSC